MGDINMFDNRDDLGDLRSSVERITYQWFGFRGPWHGIADEKLVETELPTPLRWLYGFAGEWPSDNNWQSIFAYQDVLLPFEVLFSHDSKLVFVAENQDVWHAGTLSRGDDPPVWVRTNERNATWRTLCDSLTQFLVTFCLHEIVFGSRYRAHADHILDRFDKMGCHISPLWLNGPYVNMLDGDACRPISFHLVDGRYLVMDNSWCGTSSDEPWVRFPDLFKLPNEHGRGIDPFAPIPDQVSVPDFIRKSHLEKLIRRHESQAEYHHVMIAKYTHMLDLRSMVEPGDRGNQSDVESFQKEAGRTSTEKSP